MAATSYAIPRSASRSSSYWVAALTILLWASAFVGVRAALEAYSPGSLALLRYLVASALLGAYAIWNGTPLPRRRDLPAIGIIGFLGYAVYNVALNIGEEEITAGVASFIVSATPVMMALLGAVFTRERLPWLGWAGILLSFAGVAVIGLLGEGGLQLRPSALMILLAALVSAIYSIFAPPYIQRYGSVAFTSYTIWAGTLCMLVFLPELIHNSRSAAIEPTLAVLYMGAISSTFANVGWSYVLKTLPASVAGSYLYLIPVATLALAWLWLGEVPGIVPLLGGLLVFAGVLLVQMRGQQ